MIRSGPSSFPIRRRIFNLPLGKRVAAMLGHDLEPKGWVFILGCYNSGTTLLQRLLAQHPQMLSLPREGAAIADRIPVPEHFGWPRMWSQCKEQLQIPAHQQVDIARRTRKQWSWFLHRANAVAITENRTENIAEKNRVSQSYILEKSVVNLLHTNFLQTHFAPAHFVHIVRNGYAVAAGIRAKAHPQRYGSHQFPDGYPIDLCAEQWASSLERFADIRNQLHSVTEIRYEDLVADPDLVIAGILKSFELPAMTDSLADRSFHIHGRSSAIASGDQASLARLDARDRQLIEDRAGVWLRQLGYAG